GEVQRRQPGDPPLPLLRVRWRQEDALAFPLCLSRRRASGDLIGNISVARGNLVLADHGITTSETPALDGPVPADTPFRLPLGRGPLTRRGGRPTVAYDPRTARIATARTELSGEPGEARPAVAVLATFPTGRELWTPVPDLLDSPPFARHFVAEVDNDGRAWLRFGDGEY